MNLAVPPGCGGHQRKARHMFESAELGHRIAKADYDREEPLLRARLLTLQYDLLAKAELPGGHHHRRRGRRGQGRDPQRPARVDGPAPHRHHSVRRDVGRGARAPAHVALLARAAAEGPHRHPVRRLAHQPDPRPRRRQDHRGRTGARRRAHRPVRAHAGGRRRAAAEILVPPVEAGAEGAAEGAGGRPEDALAHHRHRLGAVQDLRQVPQGVGAGAAPHQHRPRAVDRGRGDRPELPLSHRRARHRRRGGAAADRRQAGDARSRRRCRSRRWTAAPC